MKPEWRRFAPIGLYIALVAAVVSVGLYIVQREFNIYLQISLGFVFFGLALFALLDPERVRQLITGRQARYGSNALVLSLAFVGIVVLLNYFIYQNSKRWDLTEDKQFTLAPETISTLKELEEPVVAEAYFTKRMSTDQATVLLDQFKANSEGKFDFMYIDPERNPVLAEQANISRDGTIILVMGDRKEPVTIVSEQEMTGAIVRLLNPGESTIYFLTGHGEHSPDDSGETSYSQAKQTLENKNYIVKTLNLLATNSIPEDSKVLVIAGPRKPVSLDEVNQISNYLEKGGALIVLEEPLPVTDFSSQGDPIADYLTKTWGINLGMDIVVDLTSNQPFAPYAAQYGNHSITTAFQNTTSQFPSVRSASVNASIESGVSPVELVLTAPQSWAETSLDDLASGQSNVEFDEKQDKPGPISLAAVAENFNNKGRVVVFGDSDFASDQYFFNYANGDLFINSVDWAAGQENLINLTPKNTTQRTMELPPQNIALNLIFLGTVIVLPGLALLGGIAVFFQRRRRG